jgi:hypothetical protein
MYNVFEVAHFWSNRLVTPAWIYLPGLINTFAAGAMDKLNRERRAPDDNLGLIGKCFR